MADFGACAMICAYCHVAAALLPAVQPFDSIVTVLNNHF